MDKLKWYTITFTEDSIPPLQCPHCYKGVLKLITKNFIIQETKASEIASKDDFWDPEFSDYIFSGLLVCSSCEEYVAVLGTGRLNSANHYDRISETLDNEYFKVLTPLFFYPALHIFQIPSVCPKDIREEVVQSFPLFWTDLAACANRIRTSVEVIMSQQGVPKTKKVETGRRRFTLHQRIELFKIKNPEVAELFLAIKWIGNKGSHLGKLDRGDILNAYELLEHSINKLFDKSEQRIKRLSEKINKRKGVGRKRVPF